MWIFQDPRLKEDGAMKEVIMHAGRPEVETGFEIKPCTKETFNAWVVRIGHVP